LPKGETIRQMRMPALHIRIANLFTEFIEGEKTGGLLLVICTVISLVAANSQLGEQYIALWQKHLDLSIAGLDLDYSLMSWINDGLMTVFFLLVGLEIEREFYVGELSSFKNALLPIIAAAGGMFIPALIYLSMNIGSDTQSGFGIPMATDIAFSLGALSLLGKSVPSSLKIFLTALAIIDDLGAVILIAVFYNHHVEAIYLGLSLLIFGCLLLLGRLKAFHHIMYVLPGFAMWYCMLKSGIHPAVSGVLLAFAVPFSGGRDNSPSLRLQQSLNRPVPLLVLPLFALANTCIILPDHWFEGIWNNNSVGIIAGLLMGKPLGILLFSMAAVKAGVCTLPSGLRWRQLAGVGILAGMGFTMSIFITNLAFKAPDFITESKIAILIASAIAGIAGTLFLSGLLKRNRKL